MLKAGIVGLPNVGKSTLFNAVTRTRKAEAANYPFCTIDPNIGIVTVPDARLEVLKAIAKTQVTIPAAIEFVDIAGLVKGASAGEGLGNKFLTHIREVDAIVQVVRCFEDEDIHHVTGSVDPVRDIEVINLDGIPEAEALRILGVDEKGNDLRALAAKLEQQKAEQAKDANVQLELRQLAARQAKLRGVSLGKTVSDLLRKGLNASTPAQEKGGLVVFHLPADSPKVTTDDVRRIEAEGV